MRDPADRWPAVFVCERDMRYGAPVFGRGEAHERLAVAGVPEPVRDDADDDGHEGCSSTASVASRSSRSRSSLSASQSGGGGFQAAGGGDGASPPVTSKPLDPNSSASNSARITSASAS